ncbi:MAG: hypothetical protein WC774_02330 [Candidatus Gracilibacteria bacterium]|jgi:hypothetical protein
MEKYMGSIDLLLVIILALTCLYIGWWAKGKHEEYKDEIDEPE